MHKMNLFEYWPQDLMDVEVKPLEDVREVQEVRQIDYASLSFYQSQQSTDFPLQNCCSPSNQSWKTECCENFRLRDNNDNFLYRTSGSGSLTNSPCEQVIFDNSLDKS